MRKLHELCLVCRDIAQLLPPATKLGQGNIFRSVCQEFCSRRGSVPGPGGSAFGPGGRVPAFGSWGVCFLSRVSAFGPGGCLILVRVSTFGPGGVCFWYPGGFCFWSQGGSGYHRHPHPTPHRSMSRWDASYWNAFLFIEFIEFFLSNLRPRLVHLVH